MLHFSCDQCGTVIGDERFAVRVELRAAHDPTALTEEDLCVDPDADPLAELALELEADAFDPVPMLKRQTFAFDLCPQCADRFRRDPLGRDAARRLDFSQN